MSLRQLRELSPSELVNFIHNRAITKKWLIDEMLYRFIDVDPHQPLVEICDEFNYDVTQILWEHLYKR